MTGTRDDQLPEEIRPGSAAWLCRKAADEPTQIAEAIRYVTAGGRSNDACLTARRYLEHYWDCQPSGKDYRQASHQMEDAGQPRLAEFFHGLAGTDAELQAARQAWGARYTACTVTAADALIARQLHDGQLTPVTGPALGIDGAWYQLAEFTWDPAQAAEPVVLVSTMTARELAAGFVTREAAEAWQASRSRSGGRRPLPGPPVENPPRVALEEHVLAWTLHHPGWLKDIGADQRSLLWTADCRHEIDAALRTATGRDQRAGYPEVSRELQRRMLRAPGWAADQVGSPFGHWAQRYLQRLVITSVTEGDARRAFQALALEPGHGAAPAATGPAAGRAARPRTTAPGTAPQPDDAWRRQQAAFIARLGPGLARPDSVGSRMRLQPPRP